MPGMVSPLRKEDTAAPLPRVGRVVVVAAPVGIVIKPVMLVSLKVQDTQRRVIKRTMRRTDKLQGLMDYYYDVVLCTGYIIKFDTAMAEFVTLSVRNEEDREITRTIRRTAHGPVLRHGARRRVR
ncbi:hypothetical protein HU200_051698 [Digitaria exilis]|uniref:Uncharacterized protein n=1 Tax=Digitaria exilis TaxID=1010633 RepID=A0A835AL42_9POAL|nr:hypothetical protein HU200_051698 [Digitaria exilis]